MTFTHHGAAALRQAKAATRQDRSTRCYLKGFAKPRKHGTSHHVYVFDRDGKTFTANIINVATEKDFNRIEVDGRPPDSATKWRVSLCFKRKTRPARRWSGLRVCQKKSTGS
jgi:hypothetical protein